MRAGMDKERAIMTGPLQGFRVIEMAGIGPGPFACMLLSDMGAEVIRVERASGGMSTGGNSGDILARGRRSIAVNLKSPEGVQTVLKLLDTADAVVEGYRPGVMEKLGLGPDVCLQRNPRLVYARMTGWGQQGPLSQAAGHDINYIAITGALDAIGRKDSGPVPPLNLLGDFGGGSTYLVMGLLAAMLEASRSGKGQVVDAAITDGVISLMACIQGFKAMGMWNGPRQGNMLDGGAHYYDTYQCADGNWISVGSIEPQFYALLATKLGIDIGVGDFSVQFDSKRWPELKQKVAAAFKTKSRDQWCELMEGSDVCFAPVLTMDEAPAHAHNLARQSFVEVEGHLQTAPAPRFSRTPGAIQGPPCVPGRDTTAVLQELGLSGETIDDLLASGAVTQAD
jgi:alpha-methylacyl-CoA racemase